MAIGYLSIETETAVETRHLPRPPPRNWRASLSFRELSAEEYRWCQPTAPASPIGDGDSRLKWSSPMPSERISESERAARPDGAPRLLATAASLCAWGTPTRAKRHDERVCTLREAIQRRVGGVARRDPGAHDFKGARSNRFRGRERQRPSGSQGSHEQRTLLCRPAALATQSGPRSLLC